MRSFREHLLGLWWISWFGIIGAFFFIGGSEYRRELSQGGAASHFSLMLIIITSISWILFYAVEAKARKRVDGEKNKQVVVDLLTVLGSLLAMFTVLGIFYFADIAPRVR